MNDLPHPLPSVPACANDTGSWCATIYGWTRNDLLARLANQVLGSGLAILVIVVLALLARMLTHRAIDRMVEGIANGTAWVPGLICRRTPAGPREIAAPPWSERRAQRARTIGSVLRSVSSVAVGAVAIIMILAEFGLNLAPVLASAGIVGVALGFGAQNLVRDFLSGMFMLLEDQYGVGDIVTLGAATGMVESVGLRITTLRDVQGTVWHIRNGEIQRVGNKSQGYAVAVIDLPLTYQGSISQASEIAGRVAAEVAASQEVAPDVLEPPQVLGVEKVTVDGVTLRVTVKVNPGRQFAVQRAMNVAIIDAFDEAGLLCPHPAPPPQPQPPPPAGAASPPPSASVAVTSQDAP